MMGLNLPGDINELCIIVEATLFISPDGLLVGGKVRLEDVIASIEKVLKFQI